MKTIEQIAEGVLPEGALAGIGYGRDYEVAKRAAKATLDEVAQALKSDQPIPGIRAYRLATVDELIDAWDAFDGDDVSTFIDAWNAYTAGEDFACPQSADGIHWVTDGSCDNCGDKNREDNA